MNRGSRLSVPGPCTFSRMNSLCPGAPCATRLRSNMRCGNSSSKCQIACLYAAFCLTLAMSASPPDPGERETGMNRIETILTIALLASLPVFCRAATNQLTVKAVNKLEIARPNQTIELSAEQLAPFGEKDLRRIHVKDASGKELVCQAVDTDGDYHPDVVIFQADFAAGATNGFHGHGRQEMGLHQGPVQGVWTVCARAFR